MSNRGSAKLTDGSLSDTQTYAEVKPDYGTYAMWLKHSSTATSRLSDGDSIESLSIGSPGMSRNFKLLQQQQQQQQHHIAGGGSPHAVQSPRLNRSNSIRYCVFGFSFSCICCDLCIQTNKHPLHALIFFNPRGNSFLSCLTNLTSTVHCIFSLFSRFLIRIHNIPHLPPIIAS